MDIQKIFSLLTALVIIFFTLHDVVLTVLSHQGAGPITNFWTKKVWFLIIWVKFKLKIDFFYKYAGPAFLLGIIMVWYLLLNLGWLILLYVGDYTVKEPKNIWCVIESEKYGLNFFSVTCNKESNHCSGDHGF